MISSIRRWQLLNSKQLTLNRVKLGLDARLNTLAEDYQLTYEAAKAAKLRRIMPRFLKLKSKLKLLKRG